MTRILFVLFLLIPSLANATTWYVRPANDGNGTTFTYGSNNGTSSANAFNGFPAITGIAAGDTVCLPGGDEPFFEQLVTGTAGTNGNPITYSGCGATQAVIWSAQGLSGNRSFDVTPAVITTAPYAWVTVSSGFYKKRIDTRTVMLWEDATWLQPVDLSGAASEAATCGNADKLVARNTKLLSRYAMRRPLPSTM